MSIQKSIVYRSSDGKIHDDRRAAELHESKSEIVKALTVAIPTLTPAIAVGIINALLKAGWRAPPKKRAPRKDKKLK